VAKVLARSEAKKPQPNLLFIMTDQQRWDTLSYGGNKCISTPNLDRLAREGAYLDYLGRPSSPCDGRSLRNVIDDRPDPMDFTVSEWAASKAAPSVMIRDVRYKLITNHLPDAKVCDALYDLASDPAEMHNLIGPRTKNRLPALSSANDLKTKLVGWYEKIHSPRLEGLKQHRLA
jgi:arylsulfatase A-like enzyme